MYPYQEAGMALMEGPCPTISDSPGVPQRNQEYWEQYLSERTGTYEFRCIRYSAVLDKLMDMGFHVNDSVMDIGAGRQEFRQFLMSQGWRGHYLPIDGSIDGTDLDVWEPPHFVDWMVAIEVIEHLHDPERMVDQMKGMSIKGMCITTPNPETVDVLAIDRTHVSVIEPDDLIGMGLSMERATLFADPKFRQTNDSLIGWKGKR